MNYNPLDINGKTAADEFSANKEIIFLDFLRGKIDADELMYVRNFPNLYE